MAKALPLLVGLTGSTGPATQPAASALAILAEMHWANPSVVGAGAVPALLRLLSQPSTEPALEHAVRALGSLVASNKYPGGREKDKWGSSEPAQVAVLEAGGVQAALSLLQADGCSAIVKAPATRLLAGLSCSAQGATALYNDDAVPILAPLLREGGRSYTAEHAAKALCNMSRLDPIPIEASCMVRLTAAVQPLLALLWDTREVAEDDVTNPAGRDVTNLMKLLTGTLQNLAGEQQNHEALCKAGAVAVLMATLAATTPHRRSTIG